MITAQVVAIDEIADGVKEFRLVPVQDGPLPTWSPGAHLEIEPAQGLRRHYSLCGSPDDTSSWRIAVLREEFGRGGSVHMHDRVGVGDQITVTAVRNLFPLVAADEYVFVAGGIGITPMLPMIEAAVAAGARWHLYYGGRRTSSMAYISELAHHGDHVTVIPEDEYGLIDIRSALSSAGPGAVVYGCGPEPLLAALQEEAGRAGMPLHIERFAAASPANPGEGAPFEVELAQSGVTIPIPAGGSIIDALEQHGVTVVTSCQEGICGTCETKVLAGTPDHRDSILTDEERRAGDTMMLCVSRSVSPRLVLDL